MRPENGNSAWDFLRKNSPVAFPAAGELRFRLGRPRTSLLGTIFKHPEDGDFACVFLAKTSPVPADATGAWRFRLGLPRQTNARSISNLTENNDRVRDFLTKKNAGLISSAQTKAVSLSFGPVQHATFRGSTKRYLVKCRSALLYLAGGYENDAGESSASRSTP